MKSLSRVIAKSIQPLHRNQTYDTKYDINDVSHCTTTAVFADR